MPKLEQLINQFLRETNAYIFLLADIAVQRRVSNVPLYCTLHHCASIVVFNVAFPSSFWQGWTFCEPLLAEILDRVVVGVCQEVVEFVGLSVILQFVHQTGSIAFHLLLRRNCQKHDLSKLLGVKWPKDAATEDLSLLTGALLDDDHGFVNSVHHKSHDIRPWHPWKLLGNDVLKIYQVPHILQRPIVRVLGCRHLQLTYRSLQP